MRKKDIIISILFLISFNPLKQCMLFNQEECTNNLDVFVYNVLTYENNQVINFINESGDSCSNTVHIDYPNVPEKYIEDGTDQTHYACSGNFELVLGDYSIIGTQSGNIEHNAITIVTGIGNSNIYDYLDWDTVEYLYKGTALKSIHYYHIDTSRKWLTDNYALEYYIALDDYRILEYTILKNDTITNWRLNKE
jgi:hypothetical protein